MQSSAGRVQYQSDNSASWHLLPISIAVVILAAVGLAWLMNLAYHFGWYLIMLVPLLCGGALGGVLYVMIGFSRCRNYWLAGALGFLAGVICYIGYYDFGLREIMPPGVAWRIEMLPKYIEFRMKTDVHKDIAKPDNLAVKQKPISFMNWMTLAWELAIVVGITATMGWNRARHAYCSELGKWMRREKACFPLGSEEFFVAAFEAGTLADFVARMPAGANPQRSCRLILEYPAPDEGSLLDYPVYASFFKGRPSSSLWQLLRNMRLTVLRQVQLNPSEVLTLRPLFPQLAQLLALQHAELRDLPPDLSPAPPSVENVPNDFAQVWPVPEGFRQRVRSKGYALWVNLIGLTPIAFLAVGGAFLGGGFYLAIGKALTLGWLLVLPGIPIFFWGGYLALCCPSVPENRWIERRLRREIGLRPDFLVDPRDTESIYASLIPRDSFVKIKFTLASDLFLLKLDASKRQLIIEGDCDRYCIPAEAISVCEPQCFFHPMDHQQNIQIWVVRLMVQFESGMREMLLSVNPTTWNRMTNPRRQKIAANLCARIAVLRDNSIRAESA
jgi:hypothetical protein